jgi:hypothetical protein
VADPQNYRLCFLRLPTPSTDFLMFLSPQFRELKNKDSQDETSILLHGICQRHSRHAVLKFASGNVSFTL